MPTNRTAQALARLADLTPRQIVAELDRYIVGQGDAKKAVAILHASYKRHAARAQHASCFSCQHASCVMRQSSSTVMFVFV